MPRLRRIHSVNHRMEGARCTGFPSYPNAGDNTPVPGFISLPIFARHPVGHRWTAPGTLPILPAMATARAQRIPLDHCQLHVGDKEHGILCHGTANWSLENGFNDNDALMLIFYKGDHIEEDMGNQAACVGLSIEQAQFLGEYLLNTVQANLLDRRLNASHTDAPRKLVQVLKPAQ